MLDSFSPGIRACIIGSTGGIGGALVDALVDCDRVKTVYALSRSRQSHPSDKVKNLTFDFTDEQSIQAAAATLQEVGPFHLIIVATGLLQGEGITPEKTLRSLSMDQLRKSFEVNVFGPALTAKHFIPLLSRDDKSVFAALSARVGSISDNRLGGWYAYRASKAALNQMIKTLAIEVGRRFKSQIVIALHPGTVDTALSKPFQGNVSEDKLFTPDFSATKLLDVIDNVTPSDSGELLAWDGQTIAP